MNFSLKPVLSGHSRADASPRPPRVPFWRTWPPGRGRSPRPRPPVWAPPSPDWSAPGWLSAVLTLTAFSWGLLLLNDNENNLFSRKLVILFQSFSSIMFREKNFNNIFLLKNVMQLNCAYFFGNRERTSGFQFFSD